MKTLSVVFSLLLLHTPMPAQAPNAAQMDEMKKVSFLVGQWKGEGWIDFGQGQRRFIESESVQSKLGGQVLLIEGLGKASADGKDVSGTYNCGSVWVQQGGKWVGAFHTEAKTQ